MSAKDSGAHWGSKATTDRSREFRRVRLTATVDNITAMASCGDVGRGLPVWSEQTGGSFTEVGGNLFSAAIGRGYKMGDTTER